MSYVSREFYTKDKAIQQIIDRLMTHNVAVAKPKIAQDIGRNKTIRTIREMDRVNPYIVIGADQKYHISIIKIREPVKINKIGNKYCFSF